MNREYLPSKKFITVILFVVIVISLFFAVKGLITFIGNRKNKTNSPSKVTVIGDLIQKDSNKNGIPDWEEYLWGLDPSKTGPENKEYILSKKNSLMKNGEMTNPDESKAVSDNEMLSQEFFAAIISLQQSGQLDETSMKAISEAVGKNVEATPIPDIYTDNMLTLKGDSALNRDTYYKDLSNLVKKYKDADIGNELTFIIQGLSNNDPQALYAAQTVADAYISFGSELIKIPVPRGLYKDHLSAANNYEKVGQSIKDLTKILTDPLIGMKAIINYKNYSDALASNLENISGALQ